jgi:Cu/Ag efflux protein CusF
MAWRVVNLKYMTTLLHDSGGASCRARRVVCAASLLAAAAMLCACSSAPPDFNKNAPLERHPLHGEVVHVDAQTNQATINGAKIAGWMDAMTMQYPVKDKQELNSLKAGDCIDATVFVKGTDYWVGEIHHTTAAPGTCVPKTPAAGAVKAAPPNAPAK